MKRTFAGNALLILAIVFCALGALSSAFGLKMPLGEILPVWIAAALILSAVTMRYRSVGLLFCALFVCAGIIWKLPDILSGARYIVFFITNEYDKWGVMPVLFRGASVSVYELTFFWGAAGLVIMLPLCISVCLRRSAAMTVFFSIPVVLPTFVLIDFPPEPVYLAGLVACYLTLLLCTALHPEDFIKRGRAAFPAFALSALLLGSAYLIAPPDKFSRSELVEAFDDRIRELAQAAYNTEDAGVGWPEGSSDIWSFSTESVAVANAGPREILNKSVLSVISSQEGTFYLRGYSMREFDGRSWRKKSDERDWAESKSLAHIPVLAWTYSGVYPETAPLVASMTITKTGDRSNVSYTPYYGVYTDLGFGDVSFFYFKESIIKAAGKLPSDRINMDDCNAWARETYLQIDKSAAENLRSVAAQEGIDATADRAQIANEVAAFISSSARYSLTPPTVPAGEDFAMYFLRTSRQGYCIHFATSAVLMLRALDIPARFTCGFVLTVPSGSAGEEIIVTDRSAHAWVEVYYDDVGWVPLEVTPTGVRTGIPAGTRHSVPDESDEMPDTPPEEDSENDLPPEQIPDEQPEPSQPEPDAPLSETQIPRRESPEQEQKRGALITPLRVAVCVLLLVMRRYIARKIREWRFNLPDTNIAVLHAWRYVSRFGREHLPEEEAYILAQKARFSQHQLSEEERAVVVRYAANLADQTFTHAGFFKRMYLKYVRGL